MFRSTRRSRRHRNKQGQEKKEQSFFKKTKKSDVANSSGNAFFQPKLTIGQPDDQYEKEADSVANTVVNQSNQAAPVQKKGIRGLIQRITLATPQEDEKHSTTEERMDRDKRIQEKPEVMAMHAPEEEKAQMMPEQEEEGVQRQAEEEEPVQKQEEEEAVQKQAEEEDKGVQMQAEEEEPVQKQEEEEVQTKAEPGNTSVASKSLSNRIKGSAGKGKPLPGKTQAEMESSFGVDFSGVNIHTDQNSVEMNKELGAQAFTHGQDVYFNAGKFNPENSQGKHLLAHELTHVVQQNGKLTKKEESTAANPHNLQRQPVDAGVPLPAGMPQKSEIAKELEGVWYNEGKASFLERLRTLGSEHRGDHDIQAFIDEKLSGDEHWLALNLFSFGPETDWSIDLRLERAFKSFPDSKGFIEVLEIVKKAYDFEKQNVLTQDYILNFLKRKLTAEQLTKVVKAAVDLRSLPAGRVREATAELIISTELVDRNTAKKLINDKITAYYIEDLQQPADVNKVLTDEGYDTSLYTVYLEPPENTKNLIVQKNYVGFRMNGASNIYGQKGLTLERWKTLLVHEANHALNPGTTTATATEAIDQYKNEFRAYWVAEYRGVTNLDDRAKQIKAHILRDYHKLKNYYSSNADFKTAIDAHTRPDGNVTNK